MTVPDCAAARGLLPELALGVLPGDERAAALDHLAGCAACRAELERLVPVADGLLNSVPPIEPPPGFEDRVLANLAAAAPRQRAATGSATRRWRPVARLAVAAVLLAAVAFAGGWLTRGGGSSSRSAAMVTPRGEAVGTAVVSEAPDAVFVALDYGWARSEADYRMRLTDSSGRDVDLGPVALEADGTWGVRLDDLDLDATDVSRVALVDERGREYCAGRPG